MRAKRRWSDNDSHLGPFTYAPDRHKSFGITLSSGTDEYPGCNLRLNGFGHTLIVELPQIIRSKKEWVDTSKHEWSSGTGYFEEL